MAKSDNPLGPVRPFRWTSFDGHGRSGEAGTVEPFRPAELEAGDGAGPAAPGEGVGASVSAGDPREEARRQAEGILARARAEAEALRERARAEGLEQGRAEALEAVRREAAERAERLEALIRELSGYKPRLYQEARRQVVELVLSLVEKLLGPLTEDLSGVVVRVVERALQVLADRETVTIRVHPEDLQAVLEAKPQLLETFDGIRQLAVVEDPAVHRGGCQIQTPTAEIDARLETQLEEIVRAVRGA